MNFLLELKFFILSHPLTFKQPPKVVQIHMTHPVDDNNQPYNWGRCGENCPSSTSRNNQDYYDSTDISPKFASKLDGL